MASPLPPVSPGDLITSSLINEIMRRLADLDTRMPDTRLTLGPLSQDTHTLVALGTGFEGGGGIWLDGTGVLTNVKRGINLAVFSSALAVKLTDSYDTWGLASESARLASDLNTRTVKGDVIAVVTHDAYALNLSADAEAALAAVGGRSIAYAPTNARANGAFIGIVPNTRTNVSYDYLTSFMPADALGFGAQLLVALPMAWGIYSVPRTRFVLGGATSSNTAFNYYAVAAPAAGAATGANAGTFDKPSVPNVFDQLDQLSFLSTAQKAKLKQANFNTIQDVLDASNQQLAQALGFKTPKQQTDLRAKLADFLK